MEKPQMKKYKIEEKLYIYTILEENGFEFEQMDKEGKYFFSKYIVLDDVAFNENNSSKYKGSDVERELNKWAKENIPELLEEFEIRLPHRKELFGENRFEAIKLDWRKRCKAIKGKEDDGSRWYWTDTTVGSTCVRDVGSNGCKSFDDVTNCMGVAPLLIRKEK